MLLLWGTWRRRTWALCVYLVVGAVLLALRILLQAVLLGMLLSGDAASFRELSYRSGMNSGQLNVNPRDVFLLVLVVAAFDVGTPAQTRNEVMMPT